MSVFFKIRESDTRMVEAHNPLYSIRSPWRRKALSGREDLNGHETRGGWGVTNTRRATREGKKGEDFRHVTCEPRALRKRKSDESCDERRSDSPTEEGTLGTSSEV